MENFEIRFEYWLVACQKIVTDYYNQQYANLAFPTLTAERGKRYIRIVKNDSQRSAWAFVDTTNGDILKCAGWKAPARHARGNLYDAHGGLGSISSYGPAYLK